MAEAAEADDADLLAGANLPVAQRRICSNARAQEGRRSGHVEVRGNGVGEALVNDIIVGVAAHGDRAQTANRIPPSCKVYFEFALPGQQQLVRLSGEVAWQDSSGRTGIRFLDVPQSSRRLIQIWLQQKICPAPGCGRTVGKPAARSRSVAPDFDPGRDPRPSQAPACSPMPATAAANCASAARLERKSIGWAPAFLIAARFPTSAKVVVTSRCRRRSRGDPGSRFWFDRRHEIENPGASPATHPGFGMGVRFMFRDSASAERFCACSGCWPRVRRSTNKPSLELELASLRRATAPRKYSSESSARSPNLSSAPIPAVAALLKCPDAAASDHPAAALRT